MSWHRRLGPLGRTDRCHRLERRSVHETVEASVIFGVVDMAELLGCHCCGQVQNIPRLRPGERARCSRCGIVIRRYGQTVRSADRSAAAAVGALALYVPAVSLPILEIERLGHHYQSSLITGTWDLIQHGNWFVGIVVFLFSVVLPIVKIVLLIDLSLLRWSPKSYRAKTYQWMEWAGRWSMMDVLLLALLVMLVKVGSMVSFYIGPAVGAFVGCVVMSLMASAFFDPHAIWNDDTPSPTH